MNYSEFRQSQRQYESPDGTIAYIDKGEGDVILLLHGVPTSGWLYRKMIDVLAKKYRVIAPDMLGFGSSDSPKGYQVYSEQEHAKRLLGLMDSLNIDHWNHVMHDAGGLWTWELLKIAPGKVSKLILLNTIIYEAGFKPPIRFEQGILARIAMWSYRNGITTNLMLKGLFKSGLVENTLTEVDLEGYRKPLKEGKTRAMYYFFTRTCNKLPDYSTVLKELKIPAAIIWGKHDSFLLWEPQKDQVVNDLGVVGKNIQVLNAKHFIQEEQPDAIASSILNFLQ